MAEEPSVAPGGRMPVLFVGHGSPMNAIEDNAWSRGFRGLASLIPRPRAVLAVSAHWFVHGTFLTGNERPEMIRDFSGFPPALYEVDYPAPGDRELAERVASSLAGRGARVRTDWGLDHGTWSVLLHVLPEADCPVVQLSVDARLGPEDHLRIGRLLVPLRDEGVLVMASGNVTHNLRHAFGQWDTAAPETPSWALAFDRDVAGALEQADQGFLARALDTEDGRLCHPTPDHYLPLLYAAGASGDGDAVRFPITGFDLGSLSMRAVLFG
jgi:4,5-DOPA dioxygenase extradiol